jgi:Ni/Fe-hydrogenase b-type cytochrome subunit
MNMAPDESGPGAPGLSPRSGRGRFRHSLATRLWHWLNALAIFILIGSGLMISNAHPHLYWGQFGANFDHAWLNPPQFPGWITIPSTYNLAFGRRWHLLFALILVFNLLIFIVVSLANGHFVRAYRFRKSELALRHLRADIRNHLAFRFRDPERPTEYNTLQKIAYAVTIFVLIPLMILTGLTLSPAMDAAWPWLLDLFGGRASARSIHFITAWLIVAFIIIHLVVVFLADPTEGIGSMITGRLDSPEPRE